MTVDTRIRRPYKRVEEGFEPDAILNYGRIPWVRKTLNDGFKDVELHLYKHIVILDLWVVRLRFEWADKRFS